MHFFTSITTSYLPKARVLAQTLKSHNPDAIMHLVVSDDLPKDFVLENEPFDYVWYAEDFIKTDNNKQWFFKHTVVELCTAVKGAGALHILQQTGTDKIVYLDPDIGVFGDLSPLSEMLDENSVLLTPHQIEPAIREQGIKNEEICSLKHGVYNFGFFAVKNDEYGLKFLNWWNDRLMKYCYDDIPNGLFTDQKWGDLIPAMFDSVKIIRLPEYNVATWNLATRKVTGNEKEGWFVNGRPLKFYHFTGYDSGAHRAMLAQYADENDDVWHLSLWYEKQLELAEQEKLGKTPYKYAFYQNGKKIQNSERHLFRKREDLIKTFKNPFDDECYAWMKANCIEFKNAEDLIEKIISSWIAYKFSLFGRRKKNKKIYKNYIEKFKSISGIQ